MKKDDFIKLGIDEETAKKLESASLEELKGYIPKARFDDINNEKKKLELDVRDRDSQLETLKNSSGDVEAMKQQIAALQADNKAKDKAHAAEIKQMKINSAVDTLLLNSKAKNTIAVKALLKDLDRAELLEDGSIKGLEEQIAALKKSDAYLFEDKQGQKQTFKGFQPGNSKGGEPAGKVDMSKMTYEELANYIENNPDIG